MVIYIYICELNSHAHFTFPCRATAFFLFLRYVHVCVYCDIHTTFIDIMVAEIVTVPGSPGKLKAKSKKTVTRKTTPSKSKKTMSVSPCKTVSRSPCKTRKTTPYKSKKTMSVSPQRNTKRTNKKPPFKTKVRSTCLDMRVALILDAICSVSYKCGTRNGFSVFVCACVCVCMCVCVCGRSCMVYTLKTYIYMR